MSVEFIGMLSTHGVSETRQPRGPAIDKAYFLWCAPKLLDAPQQCCHSARPPAKTNPMHVKIMRFLKERCRR